MSRIAITHLCHSTNLIHSRIHCRFPPIAFRTFPTFPTKSHFHTSFQHCNKHKTHSPKLPVPSSSQSQSAPSISPNMSHMRSPHAAERSSQNTPHNENLHSSAHFGTPYRGVISFVAEHASFITVTLRDGLTLTQMREFLGKVHDLIVKYDKELDAVPGVSLEWAVGLGWISKQDILPYPESDLFPHTKGNFFLHVKSEGQDICWEFGRGFDQLSRMYRESVVDVTDSFMYRSHKKTRLGRDLTNFEDGTENPKTNEERQFWACTTHGGSFILPQKWEHVKLDSFLARPLEDQESQIGRTKLDSKELDPLPTHSHVHHVTITDEEGKELKIVRHSAVWGNFLRFGLFFIGYSRDLKVLDRQLRRMAGETGEGLDGLFTFSTCRSGEFYYAPSQEQVRGFIGEEVE